MNRMSTQVAIARKMFFAVMLFLVKHIVVLMSLCFKI